MKGLVGLGAVTVVLAILLFSAVPSLAIEHNYIEDFATTHYKDVPNTTAWWDTLAGELKLYPFVPTLVGAYDTPDNARIVAVSGDHAFVADGNSGLLVIDISDPTTPTLVGSCNTPGYGWSVAVSGNHAFVGDGSSGLQVIDISDPTNPVVAGTCDTPGNAYCVTIAGDHAFVADQISGLQVIDISDPASPTIVGSCDTPGTAYGITVEGNYALIADVGSGLQIIDISDPASPALVGTYDTPGSAYGIAVSGDDAFVADVGSGLLVIDISDPASPTLVGTYNTPGSAYGVAVSGNGAFVADGSYGLQVIDISDPTNPVLAGTCDTSGNAWGVAVSGEHAFVTDMASGLEVIVIGDPVDGTLVGTYNTPQYAMGVAVSGDHAFVADGYSLRVIDISDPEGPMLAGTCGVQDYARAVAVLGDHAFMTDDDSGLRLIDISDPTNPMVVGTCDTPGQVVDVTVSGDHAFAAAWYSGMEVIDIGDPTTPTLVGTYDTPGSANGVTVSGGYAFVTDGSSGLQVIDISDPASPTLVGTYNTPGYAGNVAVSGEHAFVADWTAGLQVIDISDPASPTLVGTCDTPGSARAVTVSGNHAFVADYDYGLQIINVSDPTTPTIEGTCNTPGSAYGVAVSGEHAFVGDYTSGLQVIQVFQSEVDPERNVGRSLAVDAAGETILRARLVTTQTNNVTWELSADGGVDWQGVVPGGGWNAFTVPGANLMWRSTHTWAAPGVNPSVTQLQIDWLYETALIDSIVDVPDDQGGWVRTHFTRSGRDFADETTLPISNYGVWQRVDNAALVAALETHASSTPGKSDANDTPEFGDMPVIMYEGKTYVQCPPALGAAASFPAGTWELIMNVPAIQQNAYIARVPTVADSSGSGTNHAVLVVTAHTTTPSIWYVSDPDSGYSLDNIAPGVPTGFAVAYNTGSGNALTWDESEDDDFQYFRIYRSSDPDFAPSPSLLMHSTAETNWNDPEYDGWEVYYKITALDYVGNESGPASAGTVTAASEPVIPEKYGLYPNAPNPFNPSTTIRYDVPAGGGEMTLRIYDVSGRLIRTLVDGPQTAGEKTVTWNGRDEQGRSVVSGVYFYRLQAPGYEKTLKMTLVQ